MGEPTADEAGTRTALTRGQMVQALRIAAVQAGADDALGAHEIGRRPQVSGDAAHGATRAARAGSTVTLAMVLAGTLVTARLSGNGAESGGHQPSAAAPAGSIPGDAAPARGGGGVAQSRQEHPEMLKQFTGVVAATAIGAAAAISGGASAQAVQWRVQDGGNGHWYRYATNTTTWSTAATNARAIGGHLATLSSAQEALFLRTLGTGTVWFGMYQNRSSAAFAEPAGGWEWVNGEPLVYTNWRVNTNGQPNEPNNIGGEDFGLMDANAITWNDGQETGPYPSFIEWDADCNNDGIVDYGQILAGQLVDTNANNIPDCCEQGTNCDQLAVGLQAHYMFNGNCQDSSGNGRNGAATGLGYIAGPLGLTGTAASFDGSTSFIQVDGVPIPTDNAFSWALWLRVEAPGSSYAYVIERIAGIGNNLLSPALRAWANGSLEFGSCCSGGGSAVVTPAGVIAPGMWAHVACTSSNAGVRRIYVNGSLVGEGFAVDYGQQLAQILIGRDRLDCCDRFRGAIDDLRFYSRPLSAGEIATLHAAGAPCVGDIYVDQRVDGGDLGVLLSHWGPVSAGDAAAVACDLNRDNAVDGFDLGMLLANWGPCGN